jgi:hypothetical protein
MTIMQMSRKYLPTPTPRAVPVALAPALIGGMIVTCRASSARENDAGSRPVAGLGLDGPVKPDLYVVEHYPISSLYLYHFDF